MIFFAENAQSWNSLLPVARRLRQRADVVLSTLAVSCPVAEDYQKWPYTSKASEDTFRDLYVPIDEARVLPWDIFVLTHLPPFASILPVHHRVAVPHGSGFGNSSYSLLTYSHSTLHCGRSPAEAAYIAQQTGQPTPANRFIPTGNPRNDRFASFLGAPLAVRSEEQRRLKASLGLASDKPLVLVSSHWTPDGILRTFGGGILDALAPLAGSCEIVQISHPVLWTDPPYDTYDPKTQRPSQQGFSSKWIRESLSARHKTGNVKVFYELESPDLLMAADLLIGDYSSIVIEFSMFDRPILFYDVPERFFDRGVYNLYAEASFPFRRADDVARLVRHALSNPSDKEGGRQRLSATFNYNIGSATEAIVNALAGLLVATPPE